MRAKKTPDLAALRLQRQYLASPLDGDPADVVAWLGAVQAQDYLGALWAVGLRIDGASEATVERAIAERRIVRTWPMRGTLHFVAPADIRWMLRHLTPRVASRTASRHRELQLDGKTFTRAANILTKALQGGKAISRDGLYEILDQSGISPAGQRGIHILAHLSQDRLLCHGPREGKQHTFVLLDEWIPESRMLEKDEALAELALRYFTSHGPATVHDFVWWTGLNLGEARAAIESIQSQLAELTIDDEPHWTSPDAPVMTKRAPVVHLLPAYDEYLVGYKHRAHAVDELRAHPGSPRDSIIMSPTIIIDGRVVGKWGRAIKKDTVAVTPTYFDSLSQKSQAAQAAIDSATRRYAAFIDKTIR